jgi:hypothetical protein
VTTDQAAVAAHLAETILATIAGAPAPAPAAPMTDVVRVVARESA